MNPKIKIAAQVLMLVAMLSVSASIVYMMVDTVRHAPARRRAREQEENEARKNARFEMRRIDDGNCCGDLFMLIDKQTGRQYLRDFRGAIIEVEPTKP